MLRITPRPETPQTCHRVFRPTMSPLAGVTEIAKHLAMEVRQLDVLDQPTQPCSVNFTRATAPYLLA
jgi:hypothetical protein